MVCVASAVNEYGPQDHVFTICPFGYVAFCKLIAGLPVTVDLSSPVKSVKLGRPAVPKNSPASNIAVSNVKFTVPDAVAAADNSNVVAFVTDAIVAPAGTPVPVTPVPALRSDVSAVVTVASVLVVVQEITLPAVVIVLPLPSY